MPKRPGVYLGVRGEGYDEEFVYDRRGFDWSRHWKRLKHAWEFMRELDDAADLRHATAEEESGPSAHSYPATNCGYFSIFLQRIADELLERDVDLRNPEDVEYLISWAEGMPDPGQPSARALNPDGVRAAALREFARTGRLRDFNAPFEWARFSIPDHARPCKEARKRRRLR